MSSEPSSGDPEPRSLATVLYARDQHAPTLEREWTDLIQSIATGDQGALNALYERANRTIFTLTMRITSNRQAAEELTLDVFHDVWRNASKYDPATGSVLGWILNQARSRAIDRARFERRQKRVDPGGEDWREWTPPRDSEDTIALSQETRRLQRALRVLTPDEQQAIEATYFSELTYAEAAARLNEPLGTIKTRIRSGLAKLRKAIAEEEQK